MRIDKFLKVSRILKRRTVANEACDSSRVTVNGKPAKPSYDAKAACDGGRVSVNGRSVKPSYNVKEGDVVELGFNSGTVKFKILAIKETVRKEDAEKLYEILPE